MHEEIGILSYLLATQMLWASWGDKSRHKPNCSVSRTAGLSTGEGVQLGIFLTRSFHRKWPKVVLIILQFLFLYTLRALELDHSGRAETHSFCCFAREFILFYLHDFCPQVGNSCITKMEKIQYKISSQLCVEIP